MIEGISHITLVVADVDAMLRLLQAVFGAEEVYSSGDDTFSLSREKFFLVGGVWVAIMEGPPLPERSYNHIAFKIDDAEFERFLERIEAFGLELRPPRPRVEGEGRSIYFYDLDNHLFELHTGTLTQRLARYSEKSGGAA
ncbi:MAG TPA: FosX/FosE/FosI family fosfomycin resistance hydrolase [Devosia sp.]|jgi:catechol 2,3-dioxygenase-like lactoylglutathione lyase family enzyme|nr:FosX/FosE/FosI family fosfomycin resistance hydrolase [Devosia sp.]